MFDDFPSKSRDEMCCYAGVRNTTRGYVFICVCPFTRGGGYPWSLVTYWGRRDIPGFCSLVLSVGAREGDTPVRS